jgi:hypothetical protein
MEIITHQVGGTKVAEVHANEVLVNTPDDGLQLLADLYYQEYDAMILHKPQITDGFFDLRTGIAGEILQKFANYRMRLAIIGEFHQYDSKSLRDFILESNKGRHINFLGSVTEALAKLA